MTAAAPDDFEMIIVDDEENVRVGLADLVDWSQCGFSLVGTFDDGDRAIDFLRHHRVDVVLTDIVMARLSGLEVAQFVRDHCPGTEVVILSGHDDFAFAQKAVETRALQYLLKPTNIGELMVIFSGIARDLRQRRATHHAALRAVRTGELAAKQLETSMRRRYFHDLLNLPVEQLPPDLLECPCTAVLVPIDGRLLGASPTEREQRLTFLCEPADAAEFVALPAPAHVEVLCLPAAAGDTAAAEGILRTRLAELAQLAGCALPAIVENRFATVAQWITEQRLTGSAVAATAMPSTNTPADRYPAVTKALRFIDDHIESDITIETVADAVNLSISYFSRQFHESMGATFSQHLRRCRVERAKHYLVTTTMGIPEISERIGYRSLKHFYRVFHELTATSPAAFRGRGRNPHR